MVFGVLNVLQVICMFLHCNLFHVIYFTSHVICCTPATATSLRQDNVCRQPYDRYSGTVWRHVES